MSKLQDKCRSVKIYNDSNFFGDQPYIWYRPQGIGRDLTTSAWMLSKRGTKFDGHWTDYGNKSFGVYRVSDRRSVLQEAFNFALNHFGIKEFARSPFGAWGDAEFVKARLKEIDEMYKALVKE